MEDVISQNLNGKIQEIRNVNVLPENKVIPVVKISASLIKNTQEIFCCGNCLDLQWKKRLFGAGRSWKVKSVLSEHSVSAQELWKQVKQVTNPVKTLKLLKI